MEWSHKFFLLSRKDSVNVPTNRAEKQALQAAGLGERVVVLSFSQQLHSKLLDIFPELRCCGGYELLRCHQGSKRLHPIASSSAGHTPYSLSSEVRQSRIYIRPIQNDIPLQNLSVGEAQVPREKCLMCSVMVELTELSTHMQQCTVDEDFEIPTVRFRVPGTTSQTAEANASKAPAPLPIPLVGVGTPLSTNSPVYVPSDDSSGESSEHGKIDILFDMFPQYTILQVRKILSFVHSDVDQACSLLLCDLNSKTLLRVFRAAQMSCRCRHVSIDPNRVLVDGLTKLYKKENFNVSVPVEINFENQPAIDLGSVRRQFFSTFIKELATSSELNLFQGSYEEGKMLPCINHEAILNGNFKLFGKVVVHSLMMEGPVFPCLPPAIYMYIAGIPMEELLPYLSVDYIPADAKYVVTQISSAEIDQELANIMNDDVCANVLSHSGCTTVINVSTKYLTLQNLLLYETILRRKPVINQFAEGLDVLGFRKMVEDFRDSFQDVFIGGARNPTCDDLVAMLKPPSIRMKQMERETFTYLQEYLHSLDEARCCQFLQFMTGSPSVPPIGLSRRGINIQFIRGEEAIGIHVSTCFGVLRLPVFRSVESLAMSMDAVIDDCSTFTSI